MPDMPPNRPPVPGWMWMTFAFGLVPVGALLCMALAHSSANEIGGAGASGAVAGLVLGLPMAGGLALAARFSSETAGRIVLGVMFACIITVGLAGIVFAGCMCLMGGMNMH